MDIQKLEFLYLHKKYSYPIHLHNCDIYSDNQNIHSFRQHIRVIHNNNVVQILGLWLKHIKYSNQRYQHKNNMRNHKLNIELQYQC
jgi:hypothetical protein